MTEPRRPRAGGPAGPGDLRRAQYRQQILRTELTRVRTAAAAWRNGLGALLAGLIGFSLIKGRSDIGGLAPTAAVIVGLLLLAGLVAGAAGGLLLLRAAHGRLSVVDVDQLPPEPIADHVEALASAYSLRRGIVATAACAAFLVAAVALTWYGPSNTKPQLRVHQTEGGANCGSVVRVGAGVVVLKATGGEVSIPLNGVAALEPVTACP